MVEVGCHNLQLAEGTGWRRSSWDDYLDPRCRAIGVPFTPPWPLPKIFKLTKKGKLIDGIFRGETINTPSMLLSPIIWMP